FAQGSFLAAPLAPVCCDAGCRGARWPRDFVLRVAVWVGMVRRRCAHCDHGHLADCAEMVAVSGANRSGGTRWFRGAPPLPREIERPFEVRRGKVGGELWETIENAKRDGVRVTKREAGSQDAGGNPYG